MIATKATWAFFLLYECTNQYQPVNWQNFIVILPGWVQRPLIQIYDVSSKESNGWPQIRHSSFQHHKWKINEFKSSAIIIHPKKVWPRSDPKNRLFMINQRRLNDKKLTCENFSLDSFIERIFILIKISQGITHRTVNNYRGSSSIEYLDIQFIHTWI